MYPQNSIQQQYKQNAILTATPQELTLALYNGCLRFLRQAQVALEAKDIGKVNDNLLRAQDVISELILGLNKNYAVSENLAALYEYFKRRLIEANVSKDAEIINEVRSFIEELRDTWVQAMKMAKQQGSSAQSSLDEKVRA
jgi:flagellar protein FliS